MLTGLPRVGKTTMVNYSALDVNIAGATTREVREGRLRLGFKITNLATGEERWLARRGQVREPRTGPYNVVSADLERIGVVALQKAVDEPVGPVIVDEIGPMEMTSGSFRTNVSRLLTGRTPVLATVKFRSHYSEIETARNASVQLVMTTDNHEQIYERIIAHLDDSSRQARS